MNAVTLACLLLLPPVAPGQPERPYTLQSTLIKQDECEAHKPKFIAECKANPKHARDLEIPGARVVAQCGEARK